MFGLSFKKIGLFASTNNPISEYLIHINNIEILFIKNNINSEYCKDKLDNLKRHFPDYFEQKNYLAVKSICITIDRVLYDQGQGNKEIQNEINILLRKFSAYCNR